MKTAVPLRVLAHLALATLLGSCAEPVSYQVSEERAAAATSYAQAPRDRPGLGTRWGETRRSSAREIRFVRATPNEPLATRKSSITTALGSTRWQTQARRNANGRFCQHYDLHPRLKHTWTCCPQPA